MKETSYFRVEQAICAFQQGIPVILTDSELREDEGDLIIAADKVTSKWINFMSRYGRGLICLPMSEAHFKRLGISMMVENNQAHFGTAFGVSIGAANGITTGISAQDRAQTIRVAVDPASTPDSLVRPGHVFPLRANPRGVLARQGHTEGAVDLARLAGFSEAAVLCEIINDDGTMARADELEVFANTHQLVRLSIEDLVNYRMQRECLVTEVAEATLPLAGHSAVTVKVFRDIITEQEHTVLIFESLSAKQPPLVRLHSQCLTGDVFGSLRCDCGEQLQLAIEQMSQQGGILVYLNQEGRGIGLANKIKSYALQDQGFDTVQANHELGFAADERQYGLAAHILKVLGLQSVRLMTNNPVKVSGLEYYGILVTERVPLEVSANAVNTQYLKTKKDKLGHLLDCIK